MKDISMLHPLVQEKCRMLIERAASRLQLNISVTMTLRTDAEQAALYAKGRLVLSEVNKLLAVAKMGPCCQADNKIVTKAKTVDDSFHGYGLAFDIAVKSPDGKQIVWTPKSDWNGDGQDDWAQVGQLAEECGLEWGGNWTGMPDPPHYQDRMGLTILRLKTARIKSGQTITDDDINLC